MQTPVYETALEPREPDDDIEAFLDLARYAEADDAAELRRELAEDPSAVEWQDLQGRTATHMAAANGHLSTLEVLLARRPRPDVPNVEGNTALHFAALNNRVEAARRLLAAGWSVNARNVFGLTTLQVIANKGYDEMEALLEEHDETLDDYEPPANSGARVQAPAPTPAATAAATKSPAGPAQARAAPSAAAPAAKSAAAVKTPAPVPTREGLLGSTDVDGVE